MNPTQDQFAAFQHAFDYLNTALFSGTLPTCMLNFSRKQKALSSFIPGVWDQGDKRTDEISINTDHLDRPMAEIMASLAHEMCHLWQEHHGKPGKGGYHNKEWADKMESIGLDPISTKGDGAKTGNSVTHIIVPGGLFHVTFRRMDQDAVFPWRSFRVTEKKKKTTRKTKYVCPECGATVWGKPEMNVTCGDCEVDLEES